MPLKEFIHSGYSCYSNRSEIIGVTVKSMIKWIFVSTSVHFLRTILEHYIVDEILHTILIKQVTTK